jgi:predicted nucleic acid-binding protein
MLFVATIRERLVLITLTDQEYLDAVEQAAEAGLAGGSIYDALIARCALKAKAEVIYTWDVSDFRRLGSEVSRRVKTPYHPTA